MKLVNIGNGSSIQAARVVAVFPLDQSVEDRINQADKKGRLFDMANGRAAKSIVLTDNDCLFLSSLTAGAITERLEIAST